MAALEEWPMLDDPRYIHMTQQYASRLCKRTSIVLRKFTKGFIGCKFSLFSYLLLGILWVNPDMKTNGEIDEEKIITAMTRFKITSMNSFYVPRLEFIFMRNKVFGQVKEIATIKDIEFEDGIAFMAFVEEDEIHHYFLIKQLPRYSIISSWGSDYVAVHQYETTLYPTTFESFVKSLTKKKKNTKDIQRIQAYMRDHFFSSNFLSNSMKDAESYPKDADPQVKKKNNPEDISSEIEIYVKTQTKVVQLLSILPDIQMELEKKGGMRKRTTRKGNRKHYVYSRRMSRLCSLHKK